MIVKFKTKSGKIIEEEFPGIFDFSEAVKRYQNEALKVLSVENEKEGSHSNDDACRYIFNEGIGYAVSNYISYKEFRDPETRELWKKAADALNNLTSYLNYEDWEMKHDY